MLGFPKNIKSRIKGQAAAVGLGFICSKPFAPSPWGHLVIIPDSQVKMGIIVPCEEGWGIKVDFGIFKVDF